MQSTCNTAPFPACPAPFNLTSHVLAAGERTPDKDALCIVSPSTIERWTFAELRQAVLGTATGLKQAGFQSGDKLLLRLGNSADFPICYLAALAVDLVPVPTSSSLTERETAQIIATLKPAGVLHTPAVATASHPRTLSDQELIPMRDLPQATPQLGDPERLGYVIFTSGTSGVPRAVAHAHRTIWARQMMFDGWYGLRHDDRVMHAGAFNWTYTLGTGLMDPWTIGATAFIPAPGTPVQDLPELMSQHQVSIFAAAPGVYRQLLDKVPSLNLKTLRHGLSAGEKLSPEIARIWREKSGRQIYEAYGMSECSTFISHPAGTVADPNTLGRPQAGRRVALLKDGEPVSAGHEGTIAVHKTDPGLMLGYLDAPEETAARMSGEWFLTGDQAMTDENGALIYLGRKDDMMNAGGFRVSPIEVEKVLAQFPGIKDVGVTDIMVKADTRVIAAFYTGPHPLDDERLRAYVQQNLARYKQPRLFIHLAELPLGNNGKLQRRSLASIYEGQHD